MRNNQLLPRTEHNTFEVGHGDIQNADAVNTEKENILEKLKCLARLVISAC
jgi:hypothetical protein